MSIETYGRYQLLKRVATGGMAQIYLARQPEDPGKLLVVKRILPHLAENADFVRMFLDEARIAARLNHPNIVQIFDLGAQEGTYFIAMEYIHGEDVRRVWKRGANRGRPMPIPLVCRVVIDACGGLEYAHKKTDANGKPLGIVHRDISPQNLLVTFDGAVKVVDFGIAKAADQATVTRSGVLKGKYSYMSPEQANGKKLDHRSDIFALGVVLHELLTGNRLFKRANDILTLNAVTECVVPLPSAANPAIPPDLDRIVMKALAKEPEQRFQHTTELQEALEKWLDAHKLQASAEHLATYMQELYAERIAEEKAAGQPLVEEASEVPKSAADDELRPQRGSIARPPPIPAQALAEQSLTGHSRETELGLPALSDLESTHAERPQHRSSSSSARVAKTGESKATPPISVSLSARPPLPPPPEPNRPSGAARPEPRFETNRFAVEPGEESLAPTQTTEAETSPLRQQLDEASESFTMTRPNRRVRALPIAISLVSLALLAGVTFEVARRQGVTAVAAVKISTDPSGATVVIDGRPVVGAKTPCTLPSVPAGTHQLLVGVAGYLDSRSQITVPESGALEVPLIHLAPEPPTPSDAVAAALTGSDSKAATPDAPKVQAAKTVKLRVNTDPPGATVLVDGRPLGRAPQEIDAAAGGEVGIRAELAGYRAAVRTVKVGNGGDGNPQEELVALERADRPAAPKEKPRGKVRFVVTPWASVSCGALELGTTPFADQELPAGTYQCRFTNPEHGTRTRKVEVKANALEKVLVQF